jgi:hypothetical protein
LCIVGHGDGDLRGQVTPRLDDLQRRIDRIDRRARRRDIDLAAQCSADAQAQFRFEARPYQLIAAERVAGRHAVQDAAEHRLVEAELLLDRRRGQAHLPADLPLARRHPPRDHAKLDAVRLVQRQPVEPLRRKIFAARTRVPEFLDRGLFVERHRASPGVIDPG